MARPPSRVPLRSVGVVFGCGGGSTHVWRGCSLNDATAAKCCWNLIRAEFLIILILLILLLLEGRYRLELHLNLPLLRL